MYEFNIDLDGDAIEDVTYRFAFDERDEAGKQRFVLRRMTAPTPPALTRKEKSSRGLDRRAGQHRVGRAHLGRQGRRSVLDRARGSARGRTRVRGRHRHPSRQLDAGPSAHLFAGHTVYAMVLEVPDAVLLATAVPGSESSFALTGFRCAGMTVHPQKMFAGSLARRSEAAATRTAPVTALRSGRGRPRPRARLRCGRWARRPRTCPCRGRAPRPSA